MQTIPQDLEGNLALALKMAKKSIKIKGIICGIFFNHATHNIDFMLLTKF